MHMYKTTESLCWVNEGTGSLDRFLICGHGTTTYVILISFPFTLAFWVVYMGSSIKIVFWSTTACIRASQHPQERTFSLVLPPIFLTHPHTTLPSILPLSLPLSLPPLLSPTLYLVVLSRFLSCGSDSLYFCYAVRTPSLSHSVTQHTSLFHKPSSVPYLSSARLHCFGFFPLFARSLRKFRPFSWNFSRFQTHLILTPLRRVSVKFEN